MLFSHKLQVMAAERSKPFILRFETQVDLESSERELSGVAQCEKNMLYAPSLLHIFNSRRNCCR